MTTHDVGNKHFKGKDNKCKAGETYDITAADLTIKKLACAIGWEMAKPSDDGIDLDISAFMLNKKNHTRNDEDFVFYNNNSAEDDSVFFGGDNRTGAGDGDDEIIYLNTKEIPFDISKIIFVLSIYQGYEKEHNFKMVKKSYFRIMNPEEDREYARFDLDPILAKSNKKQFALKIGSLVRFGQEWQFEAMGELVEGDLGTVATEYDIVVKEML